LSRGEEADYIPRSSKRKRPVPQTAQQTIPYREMFKDGICKVRDGYYTKTIEYEDINYSVASSEDQSTILKDSYTAMGVGVYQDEAGVLYWVQIFIKEN
jgi:hypothetical protein